MSSPNFQHLRLSMVGDVALVEVHTKDLQGPKAGKELGTELALVLAQEWARRILLDFHRTAFMSSSGFASLFKLVNQARAVGREVSSRDGAGSHDRGGSGRPAQGRRDLQGPGRGHEGVRLEPDGSRNRRDRPARPVKPASPWTCSSNRSGEATGMPADALAVLGQAGVVRGRERTRWRRGLRGLRPAPRGWRARPARPRPRATGARSGTSRAPEGRGNPADRRASAGAGPPIAGRCRRSPAGRPRR